MKKPFSTMAPVVPLNRNNRIQYAAEIADALEASLKFLWDGGEEWMFYDEFICSTLRRVERSHVSGCTRVGVHLAKELVMYRLQLSGPTVTSLGAWMRLSGVKGYNAKLTVKMQATRRAWVESMIAEHRAPISPIAPKD